MDLEKNWFKRRGDMRVLFKMESDMDWDEFFIIIMNFTLEIGVMIRKMVKEYKYIKIMRLIKVNLRII